jgi:hypothetical protein
MSVMERAECLINKIIIIIIIIIRSNSNDSGIQLEKGSGLTCEAMSSIAIPLLHKFEEKKK